MVTIDTPISDNMMMIAAKELQSRIRTILIQEGMDNATEEFKKIMRPLIEQEVDKLIVDVSGCERNMLLMRNEVHVFLKWRDEHPATKI